MFPMCDTSKKCTPHMVVVKTKGKKTLEWALETQGPYCLFQSSGTVNWRNRGKNFKSMVQKQIEEARRNIHVYRETKNIYPHYKIYVYIYMQTHIKHTYLCTCMYTYMCICIRERKKVIPNTYILTLGKWFGKATGLMDCRSLKPKMGLEPSPRIFGLFLASRDRFIPRKHLRLEEIMKENN